MFNTHKNSENCHIHHRWLKTVAFGYFAWWRCYREQRYLQRNYQALDLIVTCISVFFIESTIEFHRVLNPSKVIYLLMITTDKESLKVVITYSKISWTKPVLSIQLLITQSHDQLLHSLTVTINRATINQSRSSFR